MQLDFDPCFICWNLLKILVLPQNIYFKGIIKIVLIRTQGFLEILHRQRDLSFFLSPNDVRCVWEGCGAKVSRDGNGENKILKRSLSRSIISTSNCTWIFSGKSWMKQHKAKVRQRSKQMISFFFFLFWWKKIGRFNYIYLNL